MTWLKLTKKALELKEQNSTIEEVQVESYPKNPTEDWIEEFPTRWFEGEDAPKTMIISRNDVELLDIEKGAIKLKILEKLGLNFDPNNDLDDQQKSEKVKNISDELKKLSQNSGVDILTLAFYSTQLISKKKFEETSTQEQLQKICDILRCKIDDLKGEEEDIPLFKFDIDLYIKKKYQNEAEFIKETNTSAEFIEILRTEHIDISFNNPFGDYTWTDYLEDWIRRFWSW
ncbi:MAG: hypothetical protein F6K22_11270 [Okeania sp. SIO2F4]|uniref:hypothetical protein n=1 Tax=Okeania sp. SIO2F4 TaxID=2607790 RepID=UPI00142B9CC0|nr:hypothetical protein [Okeania sp. SIO2F4]NES03371.1 hypothetical protein [Okeania sp. SIO2F4]